MKGILEVNVLDFGVTSGKEAQTLGFQKAIDYCYLNGGGSVIVPAGNYYIGGIRLRSNICFYLLENAHLIASQKPEDYFGFLDDHIDPLNEEEKTNVSWLPVSVRKNYDHMNKIGSRWNNALIRAFGESNVSIIGEKNTSIDGRDCFDQQGEEGYRGPHVINFHRCKNIILSGYEIINSANWAHALFDCENIHISSIRVTAGHDGVHFTTCDNIVIKDSIFETGDDCIAGIDNVNVKVSNCYLNTACSGLRFGGTKVSVENCEFKGPAKYLFRGSLSDDEKRSMTVRKGDHRYNMLSAYTYYADFSRPIRNMPSDIVVKNCKFFNVDRFVHYNFSGNEAWQKNKPLKNISFMNITAENIKKPLTLYGDANIRINVNMENIQVLFAEDSDKVSFIHLCNYEKIYLNHVKVMNNHSIPLIKKWSDNGEIIIHDLQCDVSKEDLQGMAKQNFDCEAI